MVDLWVCNCRKNCSSLTVRNASWNPSYFEFGEGQEENAAVQTKASTTPIVRFEASGTYAGARQLRYDTVFQCFTWNIVKKKGHPELQCVFQRWDPHQKYHIQQQPYNFTLAGMQLVSILHTICRREGGRFYLRSLPLHVEDVTSLPELRRLNGVECGSWREAFMARGVFSDGAKWIQVLPDGFRSRFVVFLLKHGFATLLANCKHSSL